MVNGVVAVAAIVAGVLLLEAGADRLSDATVALARLLHAPEYVIGLLTAGGEWEELLVVVAAMASGYPALAVGNVIGSCLANLIGSMPLGFLGPRPLIPDRSARVYGLVLLAVTLLAALFLFDGQLAPAEGGLLVVVFVAYLASIALVVERGWLRHVTDDGAADDRAEGDEASHGLAYLIGLLIVALVLLAIGAELAVQGAVAIAQQFNISEYAIGATIVAVGTTLPDKAISFVAGRRGQSGVVLANATGSNIFVLTLVLGVAALFSSSGLELAADVARIDVPLLVAVSLLIVLLFHRPTLGRGTAIALLSLYGAYFVYALIRGG